MARIYLDVTFAMMMITYTCVYRWYVKPAIRTVDPRKVLQGLILVHCGRFIGPISLIPGITLPGLSPKFAYPQALGDFATALFGLLAVYAIRRGWRMAIPWTVFFNVFGLADIAYAGVQMARFDAASYVGAMYYLLVLYVPLLVLSHILIFKRLRAGRAGSGRVAATA